MAAASGWVMFALVVVGLLGVVPFISGESVSVLSILKASKEAIESYDVERNMEIVHKHYFTTTKEDSVWYRALKESRKSFKTELDLDESVFFEKLIQKTGTHYQSCIHLRQGVTKAQCFYHLSGLLIEMEAGIRWDVVPIYQLRSDKAKLGMLYAAAVVLNAHLSLIATKSFEYFDNVRVVKERVKPFLRVVNKAHSNLLNYVESMELWLVDQVSPATICILTETMWKVFQQACEARWIASDAARVDARTFLKESDNDNSNKRSLYGNGSTQQEIYILGNDDTMYDVRKDKIVVMPESPEIQNEEANDVSFENDFLNIEERSVMKTLDTFGGNKGKYVTNFRAQVHDFIEKKVIYEEFMTANTTSLGDAMDTLSRHALEARAKHFEGLNHKLDLTKEITEMTKGILLRTSSHIEHCSETISFESRRSSFHRSDSLNEYETMVNTNLTNDFYGTR